MSKVSIYINDSYVNSEGKCALYLRTYLNNKYVKIPLKIYSSISDFNKSTYRVKGKNSKELNLLLKEAMGRAADIILKYKVNKFELTETLFIQEFSNPAYFTDFFIYWDEKIKSRRNEITESTQKQHYVQLRKLKRFKSKLLLTEIDENFLKSYQNWLLRKEKNSINTAHNSLKTLKTYVLMAFREKLIKENPYEFFKLKKEKTYPIFLTIEERDKLIELYNKRTLSEKLQNTLRWFLFSCYTGLRISDLRTVRHEQIRNKQLQFKPQKTINTSNKTLIMPLHEKALSYIKDESPFRIKGKLFDCYSEPKMNEYIKEVIKKVGINKHVTFHTARHTFATSMLKSLKRADGILILKNMLGHENITSTLVYTHVLDSDIKNAIDNFN